MKNKIYQHAIECYGKEVVADVVAMVNMADPDGAWSLFREMDMWFHAECVEILYFDSGEEV